MYGEEEKSSGWGSGGAGLGPGTICNRLYVTLRKSSDISMPPRAPLWNGRDHWFSAGAEEPHEGGSGCEMTGREPRMTAILLGIGRF